MIKDTEELLKFYYESERNGIIYTECESGWEEGYSEAQAMAELEADVKEFAARHNIKDPTIRTPQ